MIKILHFADAHIDIATQGRHDPVSGLPLRVIDFLTALDVIVDTAIAEKVDLVLFAGDAYKDRNPAPTFQREWGRRIIRLSQAGIPTFLLIGNHDISPAAGRAHTLQEYETLQIPHVFVASQPKFFRPADLENLPVQILALPYVPRSRLVASLDITGVQSDEIFAQIETRLTELVNYWLSQVDANLPVILTAHASIQGAVYGGERTVMLGNELVLPGSVVCDPRLDYVAMGHIHKGQNLNAGSHPPVIYPGSIERIDFGEFEDEKSFIIAQVERGHVTFERRALPGRRFIDKHLLLKSADDIQNQINAILPPAEELDEAIFRLIIEYPRAWQDLIDEPWLRKYTEKTFEFHLIRRPQFEARLRLPNDQTINALTPVQLLELYWKTTYTKNEELIELSTLAAEVISAAQSKSL